MPQKTRFLFSARVGVPSVPVAHVSSTDLVSIFPSIPSSLLHTPLIVSHLCFACLLVIRRRGLTQPNLGAFVPGAPAEETAATGAERRHEQILGCGGGDGVDEIQVPPTNKSETS